MSVFFSSISAYYILFFFFDTPYVCSRVFPFCNLIFVSIFHFFIFSFFFFFKQKTAYGLRISDWSSDVCSSDLPLGRAALRPAPRGGGPAIEIGGRIAVGLVLDRVFEPRVDEIGGDVGDRGILIRLGEDDHHPRLARHRHELERKSVVQGKSGSGRLDLGGRRIIKKKKNH